ncbi:MAG: hypothetical protein P8J89_02660, partial [Phycisphaerales bacterium]|nr:hypothetical protein [Phycisphaerales bacterium]
MTSRFPINLMAPVLIGIPVLALGIWLSLMWNHESRAAVKVLAHDKIEQIHELAALKIHDMTQIPPLICKLNEAFIRDDELDPDDLMSWHPRLLDELLIFRMISSITWGSADGRGLWLGRYADGNMFFAVKDDGDSKTMREWELNKDGSLPDVPTNSFELELRSRPWYSIPTAQGKGAWTNPYIWAGENG